MNVYPDGFSLSRLRFFTLYFIFYAEHHIKYHNHCQHPKSHSLFLKQELNKPLLNCRNKTTCQTHSTNLKHKKNVISSCQHSIFKNRISHSPELPKTHQLYAAKQLSLEVNTPCQQSTKHFNQYHLLHIVREIYPNLPVERMLLVIASAMPTFSSFFGLAVKTGQVSHIGNPTFMPGYKPSDMSDLLEKSKCHVSSSMSSQS